jgi:threonine/homoserine/homoserine lactone efflux protein
MLVSVLLLASFSSYKSILGVVSIVGGMFLLYLAYESFRIDGFEVKIDEAEPKSILRGALVNALNPHPYLFWMTVGAPTLLMSWTESPLLPVIFLGSFYGCLVGSKILLAALAGKSRQFLSGKTYIFINRVLGLAILVLAIVLLRDGWRLLN